MNVKIRKVYLTYIHIYVGVPGLQRGLASTRVQHRINRKLF